MPTLFHKENPEFNESGIYGERLFSIALLKIQPHDGRHLYICFY